MTRKKLEVPRNVAEAAQRIREGYHAGEDTQIVAMWIEDLQNPETSYEVNNERYLNLLKTMAENRWLDLKEEDFEWILWERTPFPACPIRETLDAVALELDRAAAYAHRMHD